MIADIDGGTVLRPKLTKRQAQAEKTRKKIHKVALQLMMTKKGFNNTTIAEISQKAKQIGTCFLLG